ncbi:MAG: NAD(+) synthase, partial [Clostridia bacterium]
MKDGFLTVAAATIDIQVADCQKNYERIIEKVLESEQKKVKLLVFHELCLTGYTCDDLFLQDNLLNSVEYFLKKIAIRTAKIDMVFVVGAPLRNDNKLFNCGVVFYKGEILGVVPKVNLPNYGAYKEHKYFASGDYQEETIVIGGQSVAFGRDLLFECTTMPNFLFGVEICQDLWVAESPSTALCTDAGALIIANLSADPELVGKERYRRELVEVQSAKCNCTYIYASAGDGESSTDGVFGGHNIIAQNGQILQESSLFDNKTIFATIDVQLLSYERRRENTYPVQKSNNYRRIEFDMQVVDSNIITKYSQNPFLPDDEQEKNARLDTILTMQIKGLAKRMQHIGCKKLVLGVSGGLDSALALLVCAKTMDSLQLDRSNILTYSMPCFGSSKRTKSNAEKLSRGVGATFQEIDITNSVKAHFADIGHDLTTIDSAFENAQARERTQILMDCANMNEAIVVGTGDLSELALGFATYNGDHMSMYGVNSSVPKTLVKFLVSYYVEKCNDEKLVAVLKDILSTPISPELVPSSNDAISQRTEDIVGPYELHD